MGVVDASPPVPRKDDEGAYEQYGEHARSPRMGPGSGARRTATPPRYAPNVDECRYVRMAPPRTAETLPMPAKTNTSHTGKRCEKPCRSTYTRGCASVPRRNSTTTRREERPISKHQPLRVPNRYHRRGSGATVGDSHKGLLITRENPISSQNNKNANELTNCKLHLMQSRPGDRSPRPRQPQWPINRSTPAPLGQNSASLKGLVSYHQNPASLEGWTPPWAKPRLA
jgi:hypothetical protein